MDTSFLYNGLGLKGLECTATHYKGSEIVLDVQYAKPMRRCRLIRILMCWDGEVREIGFVDVGC